jgi:hypothetical protein
LEAANEEIVLRYTPALIVPLAALCAPLHAQSSDDLPRQASHGPGSGLELVASGEFQEFELEDGQEVDTASAVATARLTTGRLRVTAQLPYMRVTGPANVVPPSGPLGLPILVDPTQPSEVRRREGLGDARFGVTYQLPVSALDLWLNAGAKLPTASVEKGLGTGEADYWMGAEASTALGPVIPFAGISYTKVGDPEEFELRDTISSQAGAALRLGRSATAHVGYSYSERASDLAPDEQRLFGGANTGVGGGLRLGVYGSAGVSGPADIGAGVSLGIGIK